MVLGIGKFRGKICNSCFKIVDKSDENCESDSNFEFNFILIFYIKSKINFRHEMSTV